jgi:phage/plasmid-associated DNA primase
MNSTLSTFDIREHIDRLTPSKKGKNYYECPVCQGSSLSIDPKSGKYKCWSGDCESASIREAIRPWSEVRGEAIPNYRPAPKKAARQQPKPKAAPIPANLRLLQLPEPAWDCPAPEPIDDELWKIVKGDKKISGRSQSALTQTAYCYGDGKMVYRIEWPDETNPKGHVKTYRQGFIDNDGKRAWNKGDGFWPAYRIDEVVETLEDVGINEAVAVLGLEGEPNVEYARSHSILSVTFQGSNWTETQVVAVVEALRATGKNVTLIVLRDNDATGIKKAELIKSVCDRLQFPCIVIDPVAIYPDIPDKGDIKEILDAMDADEFIRRLEAQIHASAGVADADWDDSIGDTEEKKQPKPPTPRELAAQIAEDYGHKWRRDGEQECWRVWTGEIWEKAKDADFTALLKRTIDAQNVQYKGYAYLADVFKLLADDLRVKHWEAWERARYIAFKNLVLDGETGETIKHSPGMGFTSRLPYEYKALKARRNDPIDALRENCPSIYRWMMQAMRHDPAKVLKLLAIINGVLKFRFFALQMFVHLVGKPGTGKGTFARLLEKIVGRDNWRGCKLKNLDDGSTMASIIDKQLVVCPDERVATGVDAILSLTGGDSISYREVYKPAADAFFYGLLLIGSNNPIFIGDTTGLDRRLCLVEFDNPIPAELRNSHIEEAMEAEIPQLITLCLQIPADTVKAAILGKGVYEIADFKRREWEMKVQTNSVAAYFDECLIVDRTAATQTGKLYEDYKEQCSLWGLKAVSHIKYPKMLEELLIDHLQQSEVKYEKSGGRSRFVGLRIRSDADIDSPTYSDTLTKLVTGFDGVDTGLIRGSEPLPNGNYSDLRGLEAKTLNNFDFDKVGENGGCSPATPLPTEKNIEKFSGPTPSNPVKTPELLQDGNLNPVTNPVETPQESRANPVTDPEPEATPTAPTAPPESIDPATGLNESGLKIGDWVEGVGTHTGIKGEITNVLDSGLFTVEFYSPVENTKLLRLFAANELRKSTPDSGGEAPGIAPDDAEKMRDIALVWWPEMYPEALQSLVTQMFGWGEPAHKYSAVQIAQWLQGEDDLVKYRIGELMAKGLADNYEDDEEE